MGGFRADISMGGAYGDISDGQQYGYHVGDGYDNVSNGSFPDLGAMRDPEDGGVVRVASQ